eukprot:12314274-Alexandrium_andersonii.AAC.1
MKPEKLQRAGDVKDWGRVVGFVLFLTFFGQAYSQDPDNAQDVIADVGNFCFRMAATIFVMIVLSLWVLRACIVEFWVGFWNVLVEEVQPTTIALPPPNLGEQRPATPITTPEQAQQPAQHRVQPEPERE